MNPSPSSYIVFLFYFLGKWNARPIIDEKGFEKIDIGKRDLEAV